MMATISSDKNKLPACKAGQYVTISTNEVNNSNLQNGLTVYAFGLPALFDVTITVKQDRNNNLFLESYDQQTLTTDATGSLSLFYPESFLQTLDNGYTEINLFNYSETYLDISKVFYKQTGTPQEVSKSLSVSVEQQGINFILTWIHGANAAIRQYAVDVSANVQPTDDLTLANEIVDSGIIGNTDKFVFQFQTSVSSTLYIRLKHSDTYFDNTNTVAEGRFVDVQFEASANT